ncbi:MAG TPA: AMP-binding protein [Gaiellales bacterium]|jgi:acyl-CoA synthetase (AMP-forming)/AMP-acid ligase II
MLDLPETPLTPLVLRHAQRLGAKPALVDAASGRAIAYGDLAGEVAAVAAGLARLGHRPGDVVGVVLPNLPEFALVFHGTLHLGGVVTPVNPVLTPAEIGRQLDDAGARIVVTTADLAGGVADAARGARVLAVDSPELRAEPVEPRSAAPDDLAALPYSSGTTGFPKGVMLTHRNLSANIVQVEGVFHCGEGDVVLAVLPYFHIYGLTVNMNFALARGATVVTMARFDLAAFLETVERHRITRAFLVPPILLALAKHPLVDRHDLSSLQVIVSGAAPLDPGIARAAATRIGCRVIQGYGLTETSPVTHLPPEGPDMESKPGSVGPPLPGTECRAVDIQTGEPLPPDVDGEIVIRGPQVMRGYLHDDAATAAAIDRDGWFHTGDIGHVDAEGWLFIVDRLKELIKVRGLQVAPAELEALLQAHPAVADAAVVPSPDRHGGEVPKAFVVLRGEADLDDLRAYVADRVARHKRIRRIEAVDEIPRSPSGKILRRVLVEREREAAATGSGR